jgi:acetyltransferase-like isoleucine patch superfamily enzyme
MTNQKYSVKLQRLQELLVTTLCGDIPTIALGCQLRNLIYQSIFYQIGSQVYIQNGVEFLNTAGIEIGHRVYIFKGVRLDAKGHPNNKIHLGNRVAIERNVNIGCLEDTYIHIDEDTFIGADVCLPGQEILKSVNIV